VGRIFPSHLFCFFYAIFTKTSRGAAGRGSDPEKRQPNNQKSFIRSTHAMEKQRPISPSIYPNIPLQKGHKCTLCTYKKGVFITAKWVLKNLIPKTIDKRVLK
jgi:hypothetical protein